MKDYKDKVDILTAIVSEKGLDVFDENGNAKIEKVHKDHIKNAVMLYKDIREPLMGLMGEVFDKTCKKIVEETDLTAQEAYSLVYQIMAQGIVNIVLSIKEITKQEFKDDPKFVDISCDTLDSITKSIFDKAVKGGDLAFIKTMNERVTTAKSKAN